MIHKVVVHDVRLIKSLELDWVRGLCVLSGETGAGKSVFLEALGLAFGERADQGIIRSGASRAVVTVTFVLAHDHGVWSFLRQRGLVEGDDVQELILRRVLNREGVLSRAFINDQQVSLTLLKETARQTVDIHQQFDRWVDRAAQTRFVDLYGGAEGVRKNVAAAWTHWMQARSELEDFQKDIQQIQKDRELLGYSLDELEKLCPLQDEEVILLDQRQRISHQAKLVDGLSTLQHEGKNALCALAASERALQKIEPFLEALYCSSWTQFLSRACAEIEELAADIDRVAQRMQHEPLTLDEIDERLFQLRRLARKHKVEVCDLPLLAEELRAQLNALEIADTRQDHLRQTEGECRKAYLVQARLLHDQRQETARLLEGKINSELPALKLERARFFVQVIPCDEAEYGPYGIDVLEFLISTNAGEDPAPLSRVASGGELSRLLFILKVLLAHCIGVDTLIFDEIDTGTGGAVAQAIGSRLRTLSQTLQVITITHSPQVTVYADQHWKVEKESVEHGTRVSIIPLAHEEHLEEVARMLAGSTVTPQARAAALELKKSSVS